MSTQYKVNDKVIMNYGSEDLRRAVVGEIMHVEDFETEVGPNQKLTIDWIVECQNCLHYVIFKSTVEYAQDVEAA